MINLLQNMKKIISGNLKTYIIMVSLNLKYSHKDNYCIVHHLLVSYNLFQSCEYNFLSFLLFYSAISFTQ